MMAYQVVRDSREKPGHGWYFPQDYYCDGTIIKALPTGDYTLVGQESVFTIDRKGALSELATNLCQKRFQREMERMASYELAIVLLEFTEEDLDGWPATSTLSKKQQSFVRTSPKFLRKKIYQYQEEYGVKFIYAGKNGKEIASDIFRSRDRENDRPGNDRGSW